MTITRRQVLALKPSDDFKAWYKGNNETDALTLLLQVNEKSRAWAFWGCGNWMTTGQRVKWAIYCAELVLPIYEAKYQIDSRPRDAIVAAKTASAACAAYAVADRPYC